MVRIKRNAAARLGKFAAGDTAGGLALAATAADTEAVTDKHPVTPAELLPARELQADMLLAAGRPAEARAAYRATLAREPGGHAAPSARRGRRSSRVTGPGPRPAIGPTSD